ncbi:hypothetical protein IMSHALPRED_011102 [Imshaugia aleurites]|uniref:DUF6590 domain-containing protein n=1 Tax=Imshaugia aleurites TaxID=172621 RepID=A0A8H3G695_9LECA|nr:hypothetical protein IMSHALPRED_011102 [Imshaugia aleurites]
MPRDSRPVWQPNNAPRKKQSPVLSSIPAKRNPVPSVRNDIGNQAQRRFAGSVVWGKLPTFPNKPSGLANGKSGKPGFVNKLREDDESWATQAAGLKGTAQAEKDTQEGLTAAMAGLTVQPGPKVESTAPEWMRAKEKPVFSRPSPNRAGSNFPKGEKQGFIRYTAISNVRTMCMGNDDSKIGQNDCPFRGAATIMSCTYQRTPNQPRMNDARPNEYRPFFKHEFVVGTILRGIIHEQDIMGTPDPAMSQAPTNFTGANCRRQVSTAPTNAGNRHIGHGDWGPIYSENRFLIVVHNRPGDHYYAVPVYSHKGNGLAKKLHKNEYVSVADGRYPEKVHQQSAHRPITALLKKGVDELLPMSAAYTSYAVPRRYGLPVAHQGRLDEESTKRLVSMYHKWTDFNESDDL